MTKAQKNPYGAGAKLTPCPILVDPVQDKPTRYVLVANDPRSPNRKNFAAASNSSTPLLAKYPGIIVKIATVWHYLNLRKLTPVQESVKLVGWVGPRDKTGAPAISWITPSEVKNPKLRERWISSIDDHLKGITRIDDWLCAMTSNSIISIDYFAHGVQGMLVMGDKTTDIVNIPTTPLVFAQLIENFTDKCSCGKFLDEAEIRFFSCEAGLHIDSTSLDSKDIGSLSVAAAFAQVFKIRAFGSPYKLSLRLDLENKSSPCALFVKNEHEDYFLEKTKPELGSSPTKRSPQNPAEKPNEQFYSALWWTFLPFDIPSTNKDNYEAWKGTCALASKNSNRSPLHEFGRTDPQESPFPEHFRPPKEFKA